MVNIISLLVDIFSGTIKEVKLFGSLQCDGTYVMSTDIHNKQPVWDQVNKSPKKSKFAFYNGCGWSIADSKYRDIVVEERMSEETTVSIISSTNDQ